LTREEAVEALGRSLLDYLPQARQPSSLMGTTPGLATSNQRPCETCGTRGRVSAKGHPCASCAPLRGPASGHPHFGATHGCRPCAICDGWGWIRTRQQQPYDSYTRAELSGDEPSPDSHRDLERRLQRTERLILQHEHPERVAFAWEERQRAQWRSGDYEALTHALAALERVAPRRHSQWWRVVVLGDPIRLSAVMRAELARTTVFLSQLMPDRGLRVPRHLMPREQAKAAKASLWRGQSGRHEQLRSQRDELIRMQAGLGWSSREIADYHSLTKQHVNRILRSTASVAA
jgi:hypothetical protein